MIKGGERVDAQKGRVATELGQGTLLLLKMTKKMGGMKGSSRSSGCGVGERAEGEL